MPIEVYLPQWGMGLQDGVVSQWFKKEGDYVKKGEALAEIDEAKVTDVLPAPEEGYLIKILIPEGQKVKVRTTLCLLGTQAELLAKESEAGQGESPKGSTQTAAISQPTATISEKDNASRIQATPVARRIAKENEIDLSLVPGSGPGGRITEEDVRNYIALATRPAEDIPLEGLRGMVAEHMLDSLRKSAQVTLGTEVDVTELVNLREKLKQQFDVTYTDLIVKAVALTLRDYPRMNAWVDEKNIRVQLQIHIGIAVALDEGLIVPVIRDADKKSLADIARESRSLAERARSGSLKPEEVIGSTFTITNLGAYGVDFFTPVINLPEVAILGVGRIVERPVQVENSLAWHQKMVLSLTFDHRAVDGAPAAEFLKAVSEKLTDPISLTP